MEASSINAPHTNDPEPDDFFGPVDDTAEGNDLAEQEAHADAIAAETQPEPAPAPEPETPPTPEPVEPPAAAAPAPAEPEGEGPKTQPRKYRVFRELLLTEEVLKSLLKEIEEGSQPNVRSAFFEMPSVVARNVQAAAGDVYARDAKRLGLEESMELDLCTERSFVHKTIAPKKVSRTSLAIT